MCVCLPFKPSTRTDNGPEVGWCDDIINRPCKGTESDKEPGDWLLIAGDKLQRLKRSLSFKTLMRSKSVENFFQRSYSDARLPPDFITDPPPPSPPSPSLSSKAPPPARPLAQVTHCFQEHVFRKPTHCQLCKHLIVGNSKQGLRCKTCKMGAHLWCTSELSQQPCNGKSGVGAFKRNFSSPMLVNEQLAVVKEVQPTQGRGRGVDPIYAALRYGTSLAQMSRSSFGSVSESPTHSQCLDVSRVCPLSLCSIFSSMLCCLKSLSFHVVFSVSQEEGGEGGEEGEQRQDSMEEEIPQETGGKNTSVSLYKFLPQEHNDLGLEPGDRVLVTDDSNEEWWKGKSGDKVGFFPANFVQRVRPGERVWRVTQPVPASRGMGHMPVKEDQICVGKSEDSEGFLKLSSGKKRGLVPAESIEEI
uniref:SH3 and cysteine rich domain 2 n=1 Tax=Hucho hucho TaxID=62062 RepID=A0A4W5NA97_9TELE